MVDTINRAINSWRHVVVTVFSGFIFEGWFPIFHLAGYLVGCETHATPHKFPAIFPLDARPRDRFGPISVPRSLGFRLIKIAIQPAGLWWRASRTNRGSYTVWLDGLEHWALRTNCRCLPDQPLKLSSPENRSACPHIAHKCEWLSRMWTRLSF